jgi:predicted MPP superfamily phosphohydrolase
MKSNKQADEKSDTKLENRIDLPQSEFMRLFQRTTLLASVGLALVAFLVRIIPEIREGAPIRLIFMTMGISVFLTVFSGIITIFTARQLFYYKSRKYSDSTIDFTMMITFIYLEIATIIQLYSNIRGKLRAPWWRLFFTYPGSVFFFSSFTFLIIGMPVYKIINFLVQFRKKQQNKKEKQKEHERTLIYQQNIRRGIYMFAFLMALVGLYQSLTPDFIPDRKIKLKSSARVLLNEPFVLKIVQLSDIHLGPMMSISQLRNISTQVVKRRNEKKIDEEFMVLMTGDFYTTESHNEETALSTGLAPLSVIKDRVFACMGNHDHEIGDRVSRELARVGATMLVNQIHHIRIRRGSASGKYIQVIGIDYIFELSNHKKFFNDFFESKKKEIMRSDVAVRLILLHNPGHFKYIPDFGDGIPTITFGGHFHGGQFSLRGFIPSIKYTIIGGLLGNPDFGLFCASKSGSLERLDDISTKAINKLCDNSARFYYAHTGTGYYGLPLRWGTYNENVNMFTFIIQ